MTCPGDRPRFVLVLEALPDAVPHGRRLAGLLRVALRRFRMRCVEAREMPAAGADASHRGAGRPAGDRVVAVPTPPPGERGRGKTS
jgi:hypothetical protein